MGQLGFEVTYVKLPRASEIWANPKHPSNHRRRDGNQYAPREVTA